MKYLLLFDTPAPWREKVFEKVYSFYGDDFHVAYYGYIEKIRFWKFEHGKHAKTFLKSISLNLNRGERFFNPGIFRFLIWHRPKVVIIFGIYPTSFIAFFIAKLLGSKIIILSDSWLGRDCNISLDQKFARKLIYKYLCDAYIGASRQTLNMYRYYNPKLDNKGLFLSSLCADSDYFIKNTFGKHLKKKFDIMFSGRIVDIKNPIFVADVSAHIKRIRGKCNLSIIGDGDTELKNRMFKKLQDEGVSYDFFGFIEHAYLPEYYSQSNILVFPTSCDCWGVVINEAFLCGVPVITTCKTAAAGELVIDNRNGYILPLDAILWAEKICFLLENDNILSKFSENARSDINKYNFNDAATGIINAIEYVSCKKKRK